MSELVSPILQWLNDHPHWAGLATFIISAAESVAIIGTIVPGSIMMTAIGALAGAGVIPLWPTLIWAILGAIAGDGISYWFGHHFKHRLPLIWPFKNYPSLLLSGEIFVHKYGSMSVFIGRFVGPVRALVPLVAGMLGMRPLKFLIANVTSAIGWAPAYMLPGILVGAASLELPPDIALHVIMVFLFILFFVLLFLWFLYKIFQLIHNQVTQFQNWIWLKLKDSRFFYPTTSILKHYDPSETHGQLNLAFFLVVTSVCFLLLACWVKILGPQNITINDITFHLFRGLSIRSDTLNNFMIGITLIGQKHVVAPVFAITAIWLFINKRRNAAIHILLLGLATAASVFIFKLLLNIPRPWGIAVPISSSAFPSGHATITASLFFGLALLMVSNTHIRWHRFIYFSAIFLILLVSVSRLYLGAHWLTDVIGGWLLASCILMIVILSYHRRIEKPINPFMLLLISLLTLMLSWWIYFQIHVDKIKQTYLQLDPPTLNIDREIWWQINTMLPAYHVSLFGVPSQNINIEWEGSLEQIEQTLQQQGWGKPPMRDVASTLHRLADISSTEYLPLISPQYLDKKPVLTLTRFSADKQLLVIRLWNSYRILAPSKYSLWVGMISKVPRSYSWLYKKNAAEVSIDSNIVFPLKLNTNEWEWRKLTIQNHFEKKSLYPVLLIRPKQ